MYIYTQLFLSKQDGRSKLNIFIYETKKLSSDMSSDQRGQSVSVSVFNEIISKRSLWDPPPPGSCVSLFNSPLKAVSIGDSPSLQTQDTLSW